MYVSGRLFAVVRHQAGGSVLVDSAGNAFLVCGLRDSFQDVLKGGPSSALPLAVETTLLPFSNASSHTQTAGACVGALSHPKSAEIPPPNPTLASQF